MSNSYELFQNNILSGEELYSKNYQNYIKKIESNEM